MTKQAIFYEQAVPVSKQRHSDLSVRTGTDYSYARNVNSVPVTAIEFPGAAAEFAIVFAGTKDATMPVVVLGVAPGVNQYVDDKGTWTARYIPAFVRRYPFVFSRSEDGSRFTLCIDETFSGCNRDGRGERLFDSEGERTQYLKSILGFLQEYQAHFDRTQAFCRKLHDLELLEPMQAQFTTREGRKHSLSGFLAVSRDKLKALPDEKLGELMRSGELELAFAHLHSLRNLAGMTDGFSIRDFDDEELGARARRGSDAKVASESGNGRS